MLLLRSLSLAPLSLVLLWWRGDSSVLFLSTGDGSCTRLRLSSSQADTVLYKHSCMFGFTTQSQCHGLRHVSHILSDCVEVCVYCCAELSLLAVKRHVWNHRSPCTRFLCVCVCVCQDWSIDLNRTLSRREKKKPSEGVTLTGISQTGSDQPVQPAKTSSRYRSDRSQRTESVKPTHGGYFLRNARKRLHKAGKLRE